MPVDIKVPSVGESITEGTLSRWLKKDGEAVRADEPVFELETDKATTEVPAPAAGKLVIRVPEGQTIPIGAVVGRIEEAAASPAAPRPAPEKRDGAGTVSERRGSSPPEAEKAAKTPPAAPVPAAAAEANVP